MAVEAWTGQVQGISKIATGTPAALCRGVSGGSLTISHNVGSIDMLGGQVNAGAGIMSIELSVDCIGLAPADTALFFPTAAGIAVASFPDILVVTGTHQYILSGGQPVSCSISCDNGEDAQVSYSLKMMFTSYASTTGETVVYNALKGHRIYDITAQVGAADADIMSFSCGNDTGAKLFNAMNTRSANSKRFPSGVYITGNDPKVSFVSSKLLAVTDMIADVPAANDIVFTLANGTAGENVTITCNDFIVNQWEEPLESGDLVGFKYDCTITSGTKFGRIVVT